MSSYLHSQLKAAAELWEQIKACAYPADRFLGNYFHQNRKKFGSRDRKFLSEITYAIFRHKLLLEAWASEIGNENTSTLVLLAAACEELIPDMDLEVAGISAEIQESLIKRQLPPKIAAQLKTSSEKLSIRYSFPEWLVKKWLEQFGQESTEELLESSQKRPPFVIRVNTLKTPRLKLLERLHKRGWEVAATERSETGIVFKERGNLFDSDEFREGLFEVQDEGSQLICEMVEAKAGEVILDLCAGGGGKSLALAAQMQNKGRVISTDIKPYKLDELRKRASRAGINNIFPADINRLHETAALRKGADKVIVDAPCSGTGTLRRNPDAKWKLQPDTFEKNHRDQVEILKKALHYLKPGGKIFYITCSLEPEENEKVMDEILADYSFLKVVPYPRSKDGYFRLLPSKHGTDGFFLGIAENHTKIEAEQTAGKGD